MTDRTVAIMFGVLLLGVVLSFHAGRGSKRCPTLTISNDSSWFFKAKTDSLTHLMDVMLLGAKDAHDEHIREINTRPTPAFDAYYTHSSSADSALSKWRGVLLQRPRQYRYRADSAGRVLPFDSVRPN